MVRKAALGTVLVVLTGVLIAGAIISTVDKTENVAEARGRGQGRGAGGQEGYEVQAKAWGTAEDTQGRGRGGYGQGGGDLERQYPNQDSTPDEWSTVEGMVTQDPAAGVDLVVVSDDGEEVVVGTGPGYMEAQGFALQLGERVEVQGYVENDELKAAQVTRLEDGQTIALRDQNGRPAWAGGGERASGRQAVPSQGDQSQSSGQGRGQGRGQGGQGQGGRGQGGFSGSGYELPPASGDLSEDEVEALRLALTDEYKAWSVYDQVIADFGAARPFTNIQRAEESHIAALLRLFDGYGVDAPENDWPGNVPTFDTLAEACAAGVQAEIDNADLYSELFDMVDDNPDIVRVFTALQSASSDKHLPAFERCSP